MRLGSSNSTKVRLGSGALKAKAPSRSSPVSKVSREERTKEKRAPREERAMVVRERPAPTTALVTTGGAVSLTRRQSKKLSSMFGENTDLILGLLNSDDNDGAQTHIYRAVMQMLVDVLPILESNLRKSKGQRGAYQLNQTVSQLRECMADIQAMRDKSMLGVRIVEKFVRPAFLDVASQMSLAVMQIENNLSTVLETEEMRRFRDSTLNTVKTSMAQYLQGQLQSVTQNVSQALS